VPGQAGFDLPDKLKILPTDLHIVKTYGNSFNKTPLLEELRKVGVDTVIITGFCAEYCVLATDRGARDLESDADYPARLPGQRRCGQYQVRRERQ